MIATPELKGAVCAQTDADIFFGFEGEKPMDARRRTATAKALCGACPQRGPCLDYALRVLVVGVWGGTTAFQRRGMRASLGIEAESTGQMFTDSPERGEEIVYA